MKRNNNAIDSNELQEFYNTHAHSITAKHFCISEYCLTSLLNRLEIPRHNRAENTKLYNLEVYGVENVTQVQSIREKQQNTTLERYGVSNISQLDAIKEKKRETTYQHLGVDNPFKDTELMRDSYIKNLGVDNPSKLKSVTDKIVATRRANGSYVSAVVKNFETRARNYGSVSESYRAGRKTYEETMISKYGDLQTFYSIWYQNQVNWCRETYGEDNPFQVAELMSGGHTSLPESCPNMKFRKKLESFGYDINRENVEFGISNRRYDFRIGNNLIEINPYSTHNSTWSPYGKNSQGKDKNYHRDKSKLATENGFRCIHVWDWDDQDKIINVLIKPRDTVYARNCDVREVPKSDAIEFINTYHLQGYAKDSIRLGLYLESELISIMTFAAPRYNMNYEYELVRYCSSKNVVGGAEKLFSHFVKMYCPKSIISYCDLSKFTGSTYYKLGFIQKSIAIGKHWYNPKDNDHITDNLLRQRGFDQLFGTSFGKGTNNDELMYLAGYVEIYDAGQATFVWKNTELREI